MYVFKNKLVIQDFKLDEFSPKVQEVLKDELKLGIRTNIETLTELKYILSDCCTRTAELINEEYNGFLKIIDSRDLGTLIAELQYTDEETCTQLIIAINKTYLKVRNANRQLNILEAMGYKVTRDK